MESKINKSFKEFKKTAPLRIVVALNAMMMLLPFIIYFVITTNNFDAGVPLSWILYTGLAYIISFVVLVLSVLNKSLLGLRIMIGVNAIIATPISAFIGWIVVLVSIILTFNKKVKVYFSL